MGMRCAQYTTQMVKKQIRVYFGVWYNLLECLEALATAIRGIFSWALTG